MERAAQWYMSGDQGGAWHGLKQRARRRSDSFALRKMCHAGQGIHLSTEKGGALGVNMSRGTTETISHDDEG